jgi:flagellar biosynthesis protein
MEETNLRNKKPPKRAAALSYSPGEDKAPILSAFGEGFLAEKIIHAAREAGVPVLPDADLASMLAKMSVGDEIPSSLYEIVAKVLLFVGEMDKEYGRKIRRASREKVYPESPR